MGSSTVEEDAVATQIVDAAYQVYRALGPGLLESIYEACLAFELTQRGFGVQRQVAVPVIYKGMSLEDGFRLDMLVNDSVICELKAAEKENPVWQAQLLSYMRMSGKRLGILINFNVPVFKTGIRRFVL